MQYDYLRFAFSVSRSAFGVTLRRVRDLWERYKMNAITRMAAMTIQNQIRFTSVILAH